MRDTRDRYLPPDPDAFKAARPERGRIIVIAPTRAACETIELAFTLNIPTYLEQHHGARLRELAASGQGFGIVAGTGTGKTLAVRPIAETILGEALRVGVVNREREATPDTPSWNVIIVTTGIARRWFQDGDIDHRDTLVVDEIHQTSAELELCLALGKRARCRYIWLSATVDPTFYAKYLGSHDVLEVYSFDEAKKAKVEVLTRSPADFLDDKFLKRVIAERRGVAMFMPTRAGTEDAARHVQESFPKIHAQHYHGGEPIRVIRPYLEEGGVDKPFFLSMTAAGQSAITVQGLDTVIIDDTRFTNMVDKGRNVLTRVHLGANELLQMAGRVHGRVAGGRVFILSDRRIPFETLKPELPEFQLAGDSERVAITCAALGVRADDLELPVPLDRIAYQRALRLLETRNIVANGRLTDYGRAVEKMPVERPWAELLVNSDDDLVPYVAVMSGVESLHRMTREDRNLDGLLIPGSDHLTAYNVYREAFTKYGYVGNVYGLPRQLFHEEIAEWAEVKGVLVKSLEDAALAMASVYRSLNAPLPTELPKATEATRARFSELLAQVMPFDLVIDEQTAWGESARVGKTSVCGSWGAVTGTLRFFADRMGIPRASIEGTQLAPALIRRFAEYGESTLAYDPHRKQGQLVRTRRVTYAGFELERETAVIDEFTPEVADAARDVLAEAFATERMRHPAVERNRPMIAEAREVWRRSAATTARVSQADLASWYRARLGDVESVQDLRHLPLRMSWDDWITPEERARYDDLPHQLTVRDRQVVIEYDVEEHDDGTYLGVARLRLPEKLARTLVTEELPPFDRPYRFIVPRGQRGSARGRTLVELREALDAPWMPDELATLGDQYGHRKGGRDRAREEYQRGKERRAVIPPKRRGRKGR
ncbi:MAG: DEAD/DEAH box helicase [Gemmatimonadaceae bacterium]|nr:DEAD/DEAH box helicase [Gemmatimonadaceae bacterium]